MMDPIQQIVSEMEDLAAEDETIHPADVRKTPPTDAERLEVIYAVQGQALQQADPLTAMLEMTSGDLTRLAQQVSQAMQPNLANAAPSKQQAEQLQRQMDMYLRCIRMVDRFAQLIRQRPKARKRSAS